MCTVRGIESNDELGLGNGLYVHQDDDDDDARHALAYVPQPWRERHVLGGHGVRQLECT